MLYPFYHLQTRVVWIPYLMVFRHPRSWRFWSAVTGQFWWAERSSYGQSPGWAWNFLPLSFVVYRQWLLLNEVYAQILCDP